MQKIDGGVQRLVVLLVRRDIAELGVLLPQQVAVVAENGNVGNHDGDSNERELPAQKQVAQPVKVNARNMRGGKGHKNGHAERQAHVPQLQLRGHVEWGKAKHAQTRICGRKQGGQGCGQQQ